MKIITTARILYGAGLLCFLLGVILFVPSAANILQFGDPMMILGAPILTNGISLCIFGVIIAVLGRIIELIERSAKSEWANADFGDTTTILPCPKCSQQLRVPKGKKGALLCPKCKFKFEAES